jgi:Na+-driven multidrug efflux pump
MLVTIIGIWLIRALGVYIFAWKLGLGLPAVWGSIAVDNALRAGLFMWYRRNRNVIKQLV